MTLAFLTIALVLFAIQAIRVKRLIVSAIWLAGSSALLAIEFFLLGAHQLAVIELSVGAGLVTVLFVFAICIAGEDLSEMRSVVPKWLASVLVLMLILLLAWFLKPAEPGKPLAVESPLATVVWQQRSLDMIVQVGLIFAGVLGMLGLLSEEKAPLQYPVADKVAAKRDRDLDALYQQSLEKETL
jgi:NADH:ubiquinone oxidoreductase subunit 6 (subunit J)